MSTGRPWQPHMDDDRILNPFAPATDASRPIERVELEDTEEEGEGEAAAEAATTPAKAEKTPPAAG